MAAIRPALTTGTTSTELLRWYWLRDELTVLARQLGISASGGKQELTARIVAHLDGRPAPPSERRPTAAPALPEPLTPATRIPAGQRCTQQLRRFFLDEVGPTFRFDAPMREHLAAGQSRTLGEAVQHWYASRTTERTEIAPTPARRRGAPPPGRTGEQVVGRSWRRRSGRRARGGDHGRARPVHRRVHRHPDRRR